MNKDLLEQIPAEEQPIASKLNSLIDEMQLSPAFQWELETQLMDKAKTTQPVQSWFSKIMIPVGWAVLAIGAILFLNWTIRSLVPNLPPATEIPPTSEISFESKVREGNICMGPLALEHGFEVFLTNQDKTRFVVLDAGKTMGEVRSFTWSADGKHLAIIGNTTGSGNISVTDPVGGQVEYVLSGSGIGYLMGAAWSHDGKQFVLWSTQNNAMVYFLNADGTGLVEKQLDIQILGTPRFTPDNHGILFYGADSSSSGLFLASLNSSGTRLVNPLIEDENAFAFSPDGSHLAYLEKDRNLGEARLVSQEIVTGNKSVIGTLPIPKGSGSALPEVESLSWSADGKSIVFDFGRGTSDRAIYLAHAAGTGLVKAVDSGYAPSISSDGKCLAYINNKQVFLMDLTSIAAHPTKAIPVLMADLPEGRSIADFRLDKLQWRP